MRHPRARIAESAAVVVCVLLVGCGTWHRVGSGGDAPDPEVVVPRLFDAVSLYRDMGLLVSDAKVPFVASLNFLTGPTADSTMGVLALSIASDALSFQRSDSVYEAQYRVEAVFRRGEAVLQRFTSDQTVHVENYRETRRGDERVIYQQAFHVSPGRVVAAVSVTDGLASRTGAVEDTLVVPRYGAGPAVAAPVPIVGGVARHDRAALPDFVVSPRATVPYGVDTVRVYLEAYGVPDGTPAVLRALAAEADEESEVWRDTVRLGGSSEFVSGMIGIGSEALPVGELRLEAAVAGVGQAGAPLLISFSDRWALANFGQVVSLLRYIGHEAALRRLRDAAPEERPGLWAAFWEATDPAPWTTEHEAFDEYFGRVQEANERFHEGADPGWLTDRGEVFITLGEPSDVLDRSSDLQSPRARWIRWEYTAERVVLDFIDENGFGVFVLTGASRATYQELLQRLRRGA
jgi:GWxTD domain-containing protein